MLSRWLVGSAFVLLTAACGGDPVRWGEGDDVGAAGAPAGTGSGGAEGFGDNGGSGGEEPSPSEPPFVDAPIECDESCEGLPGGIDLGCGPRFMYGINYAWLNFGGDFGGNLGFSQGGVSDTFSVHEANLRTMREHEIRWVRWWIFPDFRGDGVEFALDDTPIGLRRTVIPDIHKALELAARTDVHLMLTLFSFDGFRPTQSQGGRYTPSLQPMVVDPELRAKLLETVVRPIAAAVEQSPYRDRMPAWDVINEPEWAIHGSDSFGDEPFTPSQGLVSVSHNEMETFLAETIKVLRSESGAQITVGGTAMKWKSAWSRLDVDFHQFHIYDWINRWWPYYQSPDEFGVDDKPVVMGEFPPQGLSDGAISYGALIDSWSGDGYAGALAWDFNGLIDPDTGELDTVTLEEIRRVGKSYGCAIEPRR